MRGNAASGVPPAQKWDCSFSSALTLIADQKKVIVLAQLVMVMNNAMIMPPK